MKMKNGMVWKELTDRGTSVFKVLKFVVSKVHAPAASHISSSPMPNL